MSLGPASLSLKKKQPWWGWGREKTMPMKLEAHHSLMYCSLHLFKMAVTKLVLSFARNFAPLVSGIKNQSKTVIIWLAWGKYDGISDSSFTTSILWEDLKELCQHWADVFYTTENTVGILELNEPFSKRVCLKVFASRTLTFGTLSEAKCSRWGSRYSANWSIGRQSSSMIVWKEWWFEIEKKSKFIPIAAHGDLLWINIGNYVESYRVKIACP